MCEPTFTLDAVMGIVDALFAIVGILAVYGWARGDIGWTRRT